jgi:threonine/homoserine/homoserine lactone efflux protein
VRGSLGKVLVLDFAIVGAFIPASLVIILSPGADTFLLLRYAIKGGRADGFAAMFGILTGLSLVSLLLISGVGLLVSRFPLALDALTFVGIGILLFLATMSVRAGLVLMRARVPSGAPELQPADEVVVALDKPFRMSLITNVTNPKVLIFYIAFFPQFLGTASNIPAQLTLLSVAFLIVSTLWLVPLVYAASAAKRFFQRPAVAVAMEFSVAGVFLLLAIVLLVTF